MFIILVEDDDPNEQADGAEQLVEQNVEQNISSILSPTTKSSSSVKRNAFTNDEISDFYYALGEYGRVRRFYNL